MVEVGRYFWMSPGPTLPAQAESSRAACSGQCPDGSEYLSPRMKRDSLKGTDRGGWVNIIKAISQCLLG